MIIKNNVHHRPGLRMFQRNVSLEDILHVPPHLKSISFVFVQAQLQNSEPA